MLCIPIIGPHFEKEAKQQIAHASFLGDLLELRLDLLKTLSINEIDTLFKLTRLPVIFTLRKNSQGGDFLGTEEDRLLKIIELAYLKPDFFDLEYDTSKGFIYEFTKEHSDIKIILSFHDFEKTPLKLDHLLSSIKETPAHF